MSRIYLRAIEQVAQGVTAEFIELDVTSKSQAERDAILAQLKIAMNLNGSTNTFTQHTCYHQEGGSCISVEV